MPEGLLDGGGGPKVAAAFDEMTLPIEDDKLVLGKDEDVELDAEEVEERFPCPEDLLRCRRRTSTMESSRRGPARIPRREMHNIQHSQGDGHVGAMHKERGIKDSRGRVGYWL